MPVIFNFLKDFIVLKDVDFDYHAVTERSPFWRDELELHFHLLLLRLVGAGNFDLYL